ncbi:jg20945 [Pararge aegeria aegeria]|uniref:Jg20945 protein n=1 Tax=Pararge aegeria aegeria TaxID=348720 RepID=A0A8S4QSA9_9NEOP|nr:jg20945 [Pararge aegeria aegeria]
MRAHTVTKNRHPEDTMKLAMVNILDFLKKKLSTRTHRSLKKERDSVVNVESGGRLCLFVARSALSLALQALNGTPQSEVTPHTSCFFVRAAGSIELKDVVTSKTKSNADEVAGNC